MNRRIELIENSIVNFELYLSTHFLFMIRVLSAFFLFFIPCELTAQILPKEDSHLNFRIIGFSFPGEKKTATCSLEIAKGHFNNIDSFKKNIIKSVQCKTNKIIAEVPAFGCDYTWHTECKDKIVVDLHHFSTGITPRIDTATSRLRIIKKAEKYKDAYVFCDGTGALYDMSGNPVWYLPDIDNKLVENADVRDIKLTPQGTITFGSGNDIYEISYEGIVLWKGPNTGEISGDSIEYYHHEFTRLTNGDYMVLGNEPISWKLQGYFKDSSLSYSAQRVARDSNNTFYQKMQFGTVIEYNNEGKVVWAWKSFDYFKKSDLLDSKTGMFGIIDPHENSFFFDEQNNILYVSFRDISRIVKVKYPEGKVIASYGTRYVPGMGEMGNDMFYGQHSVKRSKEGYLYLYNNNAFAAGVFPKIDMISEPASEKDTMKKVWEYQCTQEGMSDDEVSTYNRQLGQKQQMDLNREINNSGKKNKKKARLTGGGSVMELPDRYLFVSMNNPFCKIFILNTDKKIMWNSILEKKDSKDGNWHQQATYRASIIADPKNLELLIWNAENVKDGPKRQ